MLGYERYLTDETIDEFFNPLPAKVTGALNGELPRLAFASLFQYWRHAGSPDLGALRDVTYKIKQDGYIGRFRIIHFGERLAGDGHAPIPGRILQPVRDPGPCPAAAPW